MPMQWRRCLPRGEKEPLLLEAHGQLGFDSAVIHPSLMQTCPRTLPRAAVVRGAKGHSAFKSSGIQVGSTPDLLRSDFHL